MTVTLYAQRTAESSDTPSSDEVPASARVGTSAGSTSDATYVASAADTSEMSSADDSGETLADVAGEASADSAMADSVLAATGDAPWTVLAATLAVAGLLVMRLASICRRRPPANARR